MLAHSVTGYLITSVYDIYVKTIGVRQSVSWFIDSTPPREAKAQRLAFRAEQKRLETQERKAAREAEERDRALDLEEKRLAI